jgi:phosphatidylinositol alpha-1,6-mannosyltransferase
MRTVPDIVLVTALYPPAVGGSAVLFENLYRRLSGVQVTVLTDARAGADDDTSGGPRIVRHRVATPYWGVADPRGWAHHLRLARCIRQVARSRSAIVHCGRTLPEGVAAWIARQGGGPDYAVWTHGEEMLFGSRSHELAWLLRRIDAGARIALANSRSTARMLEEFGLPAGKIRVVYPGVDAARFRPDVDAAAIRRRFAPEGGVLLVSVGRLQRR